SHRLWVPLLIWAKRARADLLQSIDRHRGLLTQVAAQYQPYCAAIALRRRVAHCIAVAPSQAPPRRAWQPHRFAFRDQPMGSLCRIGMAAPFAPANRADPAPLLECRRPLFV